MSCFIVFEHDYQTAIFLSQVYRFIVKINNGKLGYSQTVDILSHNKSVVLNLLHLRTHKRSLYSGVNPIWSIKSELKSMAF